MPQSWGGVIFFGYLFFLLDLMYVLCIHTTMSKIKDVSKDRIRAYLEEVKSLWPAVKGSLTEVRKPCIRPNCKACASGEKHRAYLFSFMKDGRQRCRYVAKEFVSELQKAVENGRRIEKLMSWLGEELIEDYRANRDRDKDKSK